MIFIQGKKSFPEFRRVKLESRFLEKLEGVSNLTLDASLGYIVTPNAKHGSDLVQRLESLLDGTSSLDSHLNPSHGPKFKHETFYVVPREGTRTPASSKATDIALLSGFKDEIICIELVNVFNFTFQSDGTVDWRNALSLLFDKMTHTIQSSIKEQTSTIIEYPPEVLLENTFSTLSKANLDYGLSLTDDEINCFILNCKKDKHIPTETELVMYAQVNSEHCRHKIFNSKWTINGIKKEKTLFQMIKNTFHCNENKHVLSAYSDNAAVIKGFNGFKKLQLL